jgi:prolyl 4-hydroxylase
MHLVFKFKDPYISVIGGLFTEDECELLMAMARTRLQTGLTVDMNTGDNIVHSARVCDAMFFKKGEDSFIIDLEGRLAVIAGVDRGQLENLQVLKYDVGGLYSPHFDFFDPEQPGAETLMKRGGQRISTIVVYLKVPILGGSTVFPELHLEIFPVVGSGLYFKYPFLEKSTLHGGDPVIEGEKWILTAWIRERTFI